jgi:hypothetical protein
MLGTHVWRTHEVWADEYRAYFGLSAKRGLVGADTSVHVAGARCVVPKGDPLRGGLPTATEAGRARSVTFEHECPWPWQCRLTGKSGESLAR